MRLVIRLRVDFLLFIALTLLSATAWSMDKTPQRQVRDLHYGEVLFYFYQGDYFDAITRALSAEQQQRLTHHQQDSALLTGGMELSYGMDSAAQQIFNKLLDAKIDEPVRNRAWFYLAKLNYQRGDLQKAQDVLTRIQGKLPENIAPEQQLLRAQVLMGQGQYDQAAALLDGWQGPADWQAYARFNLGVAWLRGGKVAQGERQLDAVGTLTSDNEELLALRDKANLALGYALLQSKDTARSRYYLERVRLQGPFSNQALLAFGWAASAQNQQEQALVPWQELSGRAVIDSAVQEGLLAVPYAYAELQAYPAAAQNYQKAISAFAAEMAKLDVAINAIRQGKLIEAMLGADQGTTDMGWSWRAAPPPASAETQYLWQLLAGHTFQSALKNYRDLHFLQGNVDQWSTSIVAYQDMLALRQARYTQQLPRAKERLQTLDLAAMTVQRDTLSARLTAAERNQDNAVLATPQEQDWQARLTRATQRLDRLGTQPEAAALRERLRILQGVLTWRQSADFNARLWQARRSLRDLDTAVTELQARLASLQATQQKAPRGFTGYGQRLSALRVRIAALQTRIAETSAAQEQQLQHLAIAELENHKQRLSRYRVQAQLALAQLYDRASAVPGAKP